MELRGAYPADRAAALAGVPKSTLHYWARTDILVPSVSAERVKLWSYSDVLGVRTIAWLRAVKTAPDGHEVPRTAMKAVRRAVAELEHVDLQLWAMDAAPNVAVDRAGEIVLTPDTQPSRLGGQALIKASALDVLRPFELNADVRGPDLVRPRPRLRIVPGKLSGAPHVQGTRIDTQTLAALGVRGMTNARILSLYPVITPTDVHEALDLERELQPAFGSAA